MTDSFLSIKSPSTGLFKAKGSKFLSYAFPVNSEDDIKEHLKKIKKEHFSARHHCFAWRLGAEKNNFRANDDGEPSSSAGKPILGQIQKLDLSDILIVVVRYFGGTLLGVGGLIQAYKSAASDALDHAQLKEKIETIPFEIEFEYPQMSEVMYLFKKTKLPVLKKEFNLSCKIFSEIRKSKADSLSEIFIRTEDVKINL